LIARYRDVMSYASPREKNSVLSQLKFLSEHLRGDPQARVKEIVDGLAANV